MHHTEYEANLSLYIQHNTALNDYRKLLTRLDDTRAARIAARRKPPVRSAGFIARIAAAIRSF